MSWGLWEKTVRAPARKHPALAAVAAVCVIAVGVYLMRSQRSVSPPLMTQGSYFTCDDGTTLFQDDDPRHLAPFDYQGQEAVQVFFIPGRPVGRTDSIWYMQKLTAEFKKQSEDMIAAMSNGSSPRIAPGLGASSPSPLAGRLIKRPGGQTWVPMDAPQAAEILKLP